MDVQLVEVICLVDLSEPVVLIFFGVEVNCGFFEEFSSWRGSLCHEELKIIGYDCVGFSFEGKHLDSTVIDGVIENCLVS